MPAAGRIAEGPSRRVLWLLVPLVLALHAALLLGVTAPLQVHLSSAPAVSAVQVRVMPMGSINLLIQNMASGLRGIIRSIVMRTLKLPKPTQQLL